MFLHTSAISCSQKQPKLRAILWQFKNMLAALSLSKSQIYTQLFKKSFWCTGTKVQVPCSGITGKLFSHIEVAPPSPLQKKAMTPSSSDLVSQEGVYLLVIILQSKSIPSSARWATPSTSVQIQNTSRSDVFSPNQLSVKCLSLHPAPSLTPPLLALMHSPAHTHQNKQIILSAH